MQKTVIPFLIVLIVFTISSCKKATEDITAPSITITSPTEAEEIMQMTANDSSTVTAIITDEDLHAFSLLIAKPDGSDTLLYIPESHQEVNSLNISEKFKLPVVAGTVDYRITIHAEDHNENDSTAVRNFKIKHM